MEYTASYETSYQKRVRVVTIAKVIIAVTLLVLALCPFVLADTDIKTRYNDFKDGVVREAGDGMMQSVDALFGSDSASDFGGGINYNFAVARTAVNSSSFVSNVARAIMGLAIIVIFFAMCIKMFEELQRGDPTMEMWAKIFTVLAVGIIVIINWEEIIYIIEQFGNLIIDKIRSVVHEDDSAHAFATWLDRQLTVEGDWKDPEFPYVPDAIADVAFMLEIIKGYFIGSIMFIALEIPLMKGRIALLTILIEIVIRKAFFPLAIADVCSQGMRSSGIMFMKKFLALYIRIAMCIIIAAICGLITGAMGSTTPDGLVNGIIKFVCIFVLYSTCAKLYTTTSSLASQVVGA